MQTPNELASALLDKMKAGMAAVKAELLARIDELAAAVESIPAGRDGRDGKKGEPGDHGRNGRDGKDGRDGLGFDDVLVEYDGERSFSVTFTRGERTKSFPFTLPVVLDRGFWKEGTAVQKGDAMTFGGSYWIAQKATSTKPDIGNADWRLCAKRGRDGKDGEKGERGEPGKVITK